MSDVTIVRTSHYYAYNVIFFRRIKFRQNFVIMIRDLIPAYCYVYISIKTIEHYDRVVSLSGYFSSNVVVYVQNSEMRLLKTTTTTTASSTTATTLATRTLVLSNCPHVCILSCAYVYYMYVVCCKHISAYD